MSSFVTAIKQFFQRSQHVSNDVAATIIRNFVGDVQGNPYAWDDLETTNHSNRDVDLAVRLCWYFAALYPPQKSNEYCATEAKPYFLAVAKALESGQLHALDHSELIKALERKQLPDQISDLLMSMKEGPSSNI